MVGMVVEKEEEVTEVEKEDEEEEGGWTMVMYNVSTTHTWMIIAISCWKMSNSLILSGIPPLSAR